MTKNLFSLCNSQRASPRFPFAWPIPILKAMNCNFAEKFKLQTNKKFPIEIFWFPLNSQKSKTKSKLNFELPQLVNNQQSQEVESRSTFYANLLFDLVKKFFAERSVIFLLTIRSIEFVFLHASIWLSKMQIESKIKLI